MGRARLSPRVLGRQPPHVQRHGYAGGREDDGWLLRVDLLVSHCAWSNARPESSRTVGDRPLALPPAAFAATGDRQLGARAMSCIHFSSRVAPPHRLLRYTNRHRIEQLLAMRRISDHFRTPWWLSAAAVRPTAPPYALLPTRAQSLPEADTDTMAAPVTGSYVRMHAAASLCHPPSASPPAALAPTDFAVTPTAPSTLRGTLPLRPRYRRASRGTCITSL